MHKNVGVHVQNGTLLYQYYHKTPSVMCAAMQLKM